MSTYTLIENGQPLEGYSDELKEMHLSVLDLPGVEELFFWGQ